MCISWAGTGSRCQLRPCLHLNDAQYCLCVLVYELVKLCSFNRLVPYFSLGLPSDLLYLRLFILRTRDRELRTVNYL